jgi:hypothetical protein
MALRPGLLGAGEVAAVAQEKFRDAVTGTEQIGADILTTPEQIALGFFLLGRNVDRGEGAGAREHGELTRIASIGFDAIARPPGNQRGRDDLTRDLVRGQRSLQLEATRAGFVTAGYWPLASKAVDEAQDRRRVRSDR